MFDRPGEGLGILARVIFVIDLIATFILAICYGIEAYDHGWLIFFGVLIGGTVAAFTSSLILAGFGDLVDNVSILKYKVESLTKNKPAEKSAPAGQSTVEKPAEEKQEKKPQNYAPGEKVVPIQIAPGYVQCPACMAIQRSDRTVCYKCGRTFEKETD